MENPFSQYHFFDADAGQPALLEDLRTEYPGRKISVKVGDANALIQELVPRLNGRNTKSVAFLDPYGPHLDWKTLEALGGTRKFGVIINFPLCMAINRLITRSGDIPDTWRARLNGCFGGATWESLVYADRTDLFSDTTRHKVDDAAKRLLDFYVGRLKTLFGHAATPSIVRNTRGVPIYYMLWAGSHALGCKIADHILVNEDPHGFLLGRFPNAGRGRASAKRIAATRIRKPSPKLPFDPLLLTNRFRPICIEFRLHDD